MTRFRFFRISLNRVFAASRFGAVGLSLIFARTLSASVAEAASMRWDSCHSQRLIGGGPHDQTFCGWNWTRGLFRRSGSSQAVGATIDLADSIEDRIESVHSPSVSTILLSRRDQRWQSSVASGPSRRDLCWRQRSARYRPDRGPLADARSSERAILSRSAAFNSELRTSFKPSRGSNSRLHSSTVCLCRRPRDYCGRSPFLWPDR